VDQPGWFRRADARFGLGYWHWFFLAQPFDIPERIIGADRLGFFTRNWRRDSNGQSPPAAYFTAEAVGRGYQA
jgi:haloacetate dehalogenase